MKNKPLAIATCCLAGTLVVATPVYAAPVAGINGVSGAVIESELNSSSPVAGVSLAMSNYLEQSTAAQLSNVETITSNEKKVSSASEEATDTAAENSEEQKSETSEYDNIAVAQVNDYVNIRKKPDEESEQIGKLYNGSIAVVLKQSGDWYKIESGSVTGYVKAEYVVVGDEELVKSVSTKIATVTATTLKVRKEASTEAGTVDLVSEGEQLKVTSLREYHNGWVKVSEGDVSGYVSSDYVTITKEFGYAESKEEEAAKLAAEQAEKEREEAARAAAQEAMQEETKQVSTAEPAETNTEASENTASESTEVAESSSASESAAASESSTAAESSSSSESTASASGQAVANYACQFVGNPYVYGGSSLTNGADCSGFVMSVYAHFGVSLPHSSSALQGVGYAVSYEDKQPGDIICYNGHVAIYIGNNTVVHASNPTNGIKYTSPANYRSVVTVRRIF